MRHGQTNYNVMRLHNADPNINVCLTPDGIIEAKKVAEQLRNEPLDVIFVSELLRTKQTANYINKYHDLPVIVDSRLNDINSGFEGRSIEEYHNKRDSSADAFTYRFSEDVESPEDVFKRTQGFLEYLTTLEYNNILVVTSKHNFRHFRSIIDNLDPRRSLKEYIPNAKIMIREIKVPRDND